MTTTLMTNFGLPKMAHFLFDVGELKSFRPFTMHGPKNLVKTTFEDHVI